jgi:ABC-type antimicrobial peptide transport system permease subunit
VAVVNGTAARLLFGNQHPIGKTFQTKASETELSAPITVVGLVGDSRYWSLRREPPPTIYRAYAQSIGTSPRYGVRSTTDPAALIPAVTALAAQVEPRMRLSMWTLTDQIDRSLTREQLLALLSTFFGALTLLLATIGVYGIMAYGVSRRRNEFGIRIAVGATPAQVVRLVSREMAMMIGAGLAVGAALAFASTRLIRSFLYGVGPTDPWIIGGSIVVLAVAACVATVTPALRASRVDPVFALREE